MTAGDQTNRRLLVATAATVALFACVKPSGAYAKAEAEEWARSMGFEVKGLTCMDYDNDGNGYVTCTINVKGDEAKPYTIECARVAPDSCTRADRGCRLPKGIVQ